jgi:hypothetical protein
VALHFNATLCAQQFTLLFRLNTFGYRRNTKICCKLGDCTHDRPGFAVFVYLGNKRAVNASDSGRKLAVLAGR